MKAYEKPKVTKINLLTKEAVLTFCKTYVGEPGPGSYCGYPGDPQSCKDAYRLPAD